ncbi:hypothetical protein BDY19DRAFT_990247 [Irpex rosettiformis]|uniref:Uncharacterized protein n=1 Tax=Irpex rosettiformis TaxID=378272 RepID=A0ACB8UDZ9_9APHY|nr:hypothetical protein BDY19DRAFT_990247 [Irpex rosettiformis]
MSFVNRTIDDQTGDKVTGEQVSYLPAQLWTQGNGCGGCSAKPDPSQAVQQTWHDGARNPSRDPPLTLSFKFTGNAVYLFNIIARGDPTDVSIIIDGNLITRYTSDTNLPVGFMYNVPVFSQDNLPFGEHTVEMSADGNDQTLVLFDYALYTTTESGDAPPSIPSTPSTPSTSSEPKVTEDNRENSSSSPSLQVTTSSSPTTSSTANHSTPTESTTISTSPTSSPSLSLSLSVISQTSTVTVDGRVIQSSSTPQTINPSTPSSSAFPTAVGGSATSHARHANIGAIVGGAVGGSLFLLFAFLALIWYRRRRHRQVGISPFGGQTYNAEPALLRADSNRSEKLEAASYFPSAHKVSLVPARFSKVSLLPQTDCAEPADSESTVSHLELSSPPLNASSASEAILQRELQSLQDRLTVARATKSSRGASAASKSSAALSESSTAGHQEPSTAPSSNNNPSGEEIQRLRAEIEELRARQRLQHQITPDSVLPPQLSSSSVGTNGVSAVAPSPVEVELMRQISLLRNEMEEMRMQQELGIPLGHDEALPSYSPPSPPIPGYTA